MTKGGARKTTTNAAVYLKNEEYPVRLNDARTHRSGVWITGHRSDLSRHPKQSWPVQMISYIEWSEELDEPAG